MASCGGYVTVTADFKEWQRCLRVSRGHRAGQHHRRHVVALWRALMFLLALASSLSKAGADTVAAQLSVSLSPRGQLAPWLADTQPQYYCLPRSCNFEFAGAAAVAVTLSGDPPPHGTSMASRAQQYLPSSVVSIRLDVVLRVPEWHVALQRSAPLVGDYTTSGSALRTDPLAAPMYTIRLRSRDDLSEVWYRGYVEKGRQGYSVCDSFLSPIQREPRGTASSSSGSAALELKWCPESSRYAPWNRSATLHEVFHPILVNESATGVHLAGTVSKPLHKPHHQQWEWKMAFFATPSASYGRAPRDAQSGSGGQSHVQVGTLTVQFSTSTLPHGKTIIAYSVRGLALQSKTVKYTMAPPGSALPRSPTSFTSGTSKKVAEESDLNGSTPLPSSALWNQMFFMCVVVVAVWTAGCCMCRRHRARGAALHRYDLPSWAAPHAARRSKRLKQVHWIDLAGSSHPLPHGDQTRDTLRDVM